MRSGGRLMLGENKGRVTIGDDRVRRWQRVGFVGALVVLVCLLTVYREGFSAVGSAKSGLIQIEAQQAFASGVHLRGWAGMTPNVRVLENGVHTRYVAGSLRVDIISNQMPLTLKQLSELRPGNPKNADPVVLGGTVEAATGLKDVAYYLRVSPLQGRLWESVESDLDLVLELIEKPFP